MNSLRVCDEATGEWDGRVGRGRGRGRVRRPPGLWGRDGDVGAGVSLPLPDRAALVQPARHPLPRRGPAWAVFSHEDVTARRETEEALCRRGGELDVMPRALKQRNAELDQFACITAHDLRAALRGIANLSRWIEEDLEETISPQVAGQFDLLRGQVSRMAAMIQGILRYSRAGWAEVVPEPVDVKALWMPRAKAGILASDWRW